MNDVAVLVATTTVPQSVNFGIKGDIAASFLRVNGVESKTSADAAPLSPAADRDGREGVHGGGDVRAGGRRNEAPTDLTYTRMLLTDNVTFDRIAQCIRFSQFRPKTFNRSTMGKQGN